MNGPDVALVLLLPVVVVGTFAGTTRVPPEVQFGGVLFGPQTLKFTVPVGGPEGPVKVAVSVTGWPSVAVGEDACVVIFGGLTTADGWMLLSWLLDPEVSKFWVRMWKLAPLIVLAPFGLPPLAARFQ